MTGLRKLAQQYILLLKFVGETSIPQVARELSKYEGKEVTEIAVRSRLHFGRELTKDAQWLLNNLYSLQKNQRIRKFSVDGSLRKKKKENEEFNEKDFWKKKK